MGIHTKGGKTVKLVYHEINSPMQWSRWKGEMDALVERQAKDIFITKDEMYEMIDNMLPVPQTPVALLIDTDEGLLRGFVGMTIIPPKLLVNFCSVQRGVGTEQYAPVLNAYIDRTGLATGCDTRLFVVNHAIKYSFKESFKKNDPVTRVCRQLGAEPYAVMYQGSIPTRKESG